MRSNFKKVFKTIKNNLEKAQKEVRQEMGQTAVKHFKESFKREGFNNVPFMHWNLLKKPRTGVYRNKKILDKTGKLKNSLRYTTRQGVKSFSVRVYSTVHYAGVHNYGLRAGRGAGFKMPKRQFIGYSKVLEKKLAAIALKRLKSYIK